MSDESDPAKNVIPGAERKTVFWLILIPEESIVRLVKNFISINQGLRSNANPSPELVRDCGMSYQQSSGCYYKRNFKKKFKWFCLIF